MITTIKLFFSKIKCIELVDLSYKPYANLDWCDRTMHKATIEVNGKVENVYSKYNPNYVSYWMYEDGTSVPDIIGRVIHEFKKNIDSIELLKHNKAVIKRFNETGVTK